MNALGPPEPAVTSVTLCYLGGVLFKIAAHWRVGAANASVPTVPGLFRAIGIASGKILPTPHPSSVQPMGSPKNPCTIVRSFRRN